MTDYQFIGYILNQASGVTDIVGTNIFHGEIPEQADYPIVNYFLVSNPNVINGILGTPRYQVSCRATTSGGAMDLAHQVLLAFNELQGSFGGFDVQSTKWENSKCLPEAPNVVHCPVDIFLAYFT